MKKVVVDKDILCSLKALYFGKYDEPIEGASGRAYRDMNRTIRFNGIDIAVRMRLREDTTSLFKVELKFLETGEITNQDSYDL